MSGHLDIFEAMRAAHGGKRIALVSCADDAFYHNNKDCEFRVANARWAFRFHSEDRWWYLSKDPAWPLSRDWSMATSLWHIIDEVEES